MVRIVGSASACKSGQGSNSRSRVAARAVSDRVGSELIAGRNGVAVGFSLESDGSVVMVGFFLDFELLVLLLLLL
jgi:hypothetical protein